MSRRKPSTKLNRLQPLPSPENKEDLPERFRKPQFIYVKGEIMSGCRGTHHLNLENGMTCLATARRLENHLRVSLMVGDRVYVELDPQHLNPAETLRGRIVWRIRS